VLLPGDEGYAEECATYNLALTHQPSVVVGATGTADVQAAVRFAAANGLPAAVLATGHQAMIAVRDAVFITTRRMSGVRINPASRTATVKGGVRWQQVVDAAGVHGLAPLNGSSPLTGVVGFTLGGGLSPTMGRAFGWAADHVRSADVVTADGALRHVTPDSDPDLFWALRGSKSNLGVVTQLEFGLFPVSRLYAGGLFFAGEHLQEVLNAYRRFTATAPAQVTSSIGLLRLPPLPSVPGPLRGTFTVHVRISCLGPADTAERLIAPLRTAAPVLIDAVRDMPYADFAAIHNDPTEPAPFLERTGMLRELTPETANTIVDLAGPAADCPVQFIELRHLGGALSREPRVPSAVGNRDAEFALWIVAVGMPGDCAPQMAYADNLLERLRPWSTGRKYLNFMSTEDITPAQVSDAYDPRAYERLRSVKHRYDPANIFRLNHNIPPHPA
jgi:FAD/FMN-containing dehydrogenase